MRNTRKISIFLLFLLFSAQAGGPVPDTTKSSAKISNILADPENVERLDAIIKGVGTAVNVAKGIKESGVQEYAKSEGSNAENSWQSMVFKYKDSKTGFISFMKNVQEDVLSILQKASGRIDLWRTTLPTIQGYADATKTLADNTAKVFREFKINDLLDIDRKWSRKTDKNIKANLDNFYGFMGFLQGLEKDKKSHFNYMNERYVPKISSVDLSDTKQNYYYNMIQTKESAAMEVITNEGKAYLFHELPKQEIMTGIQGLIAVIDVMETAQKREVGSAETTEKEVIYSMSDDYIEDILRDGSSTYLEDVMLLAHIKQLRTDVEMQRATLQQQQSYMAQIFARVQLTNAEKQAAIQSHQFKEMQKILGEENFKGAYSDKYNYEWER